MVTPQTLPRLRADVFTVPTGQDAAYVRSSRGVQLLAEPGIHSWIERLAPFLDGTRTVAQLLAQLPPQRHLLVTGVLDRLESLALLEDLADQRPAERQRAYTRLRVLAVAGPAEGAALERALRRSGVTGAVTVLGPADVRLIAEQATTHDAVLHLARPGAVDLAHRLDELCGSGGQWFAQAAHHGDAAWLGPVRRPGEDPAGGGWAGAWLRVTGSRPAPTATTPTGTDPDPGAAPTAVIAALLVHLLQQAYTATEPPAAEPPAPAPRELLRLDLATLTTTRHRYHPHPAALPATAQTREQFRARISGLAQGPAMADETFSRLAIGCVDPRTGLLAEIDEGSLLQLPDCSTWATLRDPADGTHHQVRGSGVDFAAARIAAARSALERYAARCLDPRRCLPGADGRPALWAWSPSAAKPSWCRPPPSSPTRPPRPAHPTHPPSPPSPASARAGTGTRRSPPPGAATAGRTPCWCRSTTTPRWPQSSPTSSKR